MKKAFFIICAAVLAFAACKKADEPALDFNNDEIVFTTRTNMGTRATGVTEVGDGTNGTAALTSFNVIASKGTANQTAFFTDGLFTGTVGGTYTGGKYWPAEETTTETWNFYASNAAMTFNPSGATIEVSNTNVDVVAEYKNNALYRQSNALTFDHIFCQLATVSMKAPADWSVTGLTVTIVPIYSGTYSMVNNTWNPGSPASQAVTIFSGDLAEGGQATSADNDLWLIPGAYQIFASYTIHKGEWSNQYTKSATVTLVQGQNNHLRLPNGGDPNIPVPGGDDIQDIEFTVEVTPWSDNDVPLNFGS